jgi:hypothetical protein
MVLLLCLCASGATPQIRFLERSAQSLANGRIRGCILEDRTLVTWGDRVVSYTLPHGRPRVLRVAGTPLAEGGCRLDVDGDGRPDLVLNEDGPDHALVWLQAPHWTRRVIDTGIDAPDLLPAVLFGRRGILLIQKRIQIRFYEVPADLRARWTYQDVYSVYTPSWQGGLRLADIDGDGRTDILCGNYWVRSPESFELPWHLFAINTWTEQEKSGMMRLAYAALDGAGSRGLAVVQRSMDPARLAWFAQPANPRLIWEEHRLELGTPLHQPASLDVADFDGDGRPDLLLAEHAAEGRLLLLHNRGRLQFETQVLRQGAPALHAQAADFNGDGRPDILLVTPRAISWWENQR